MTVSDFIPSVKTLEASKLFDDRKAVLLARKVLGCYDWDKLMAIISTDDRLKQTYKYYNDCYSRPQSIHLKLCAMSELTRGCGVEYINKGHNAKSPSIEYVNHGDAYATTIMWIGGKGFRVGCWGDIVERGNYD